MGTAPGLAVPTADEERYFVLLPGPPHELQRMFETYVIPFLLGRMGQRTTLVSRSLHFCEIGESPLEDRLHDLMSEQTDPTLATYAKPGDVQLRISTKAASREEGLARITTLEQEIRARLAEYLYGVDGATLEGAVGELLAQLGWHIAVVDAQDGGTLASRLTEVEGSDDWFAGSLVATSYEQAAALLCRFGKIECAQGPEERSQALARLALCLGASLGVGLVPAGENRTCFTVMTKSGQTRTMTGGGGSNRQTSRWRVSQSALATIRRLAMEELAESTA